MWTVCALKKYINRTRLFKQPCSTVNDCSSSVSGAPTRQCLKIFGVENSWLSTAVWSKGILKFPSWFAHSSWSESFPSVVNTWADRTSNQFGSSGPSSTWEHHDSLLTAAVASGRQEAQHWIMFSCVQQHLTRPHVVSNDAAHAFWE